MPATATVHVLIMRQIETIHISSRTSHRRLQKLMNGLRRIFHHRFSDTNIAEVKIAA
jgi:hypothetical protein